jgi:hypothetical protein
LKRGVAATEDEEYEDLDDMYNDGILLLRKGSDAGLKEAVELLLKASSLGHIPAKRVVGSLYLDGRVVEQDLEKAYELISEAVASLDPFAMYMLGRMYEGGIGVEQDDRGALYMFAFASEMGIPEAKEDADRIAARIDERRRRKLGSRPILNLEISDIDVEAVCCREMFNAVMNGTIEVIETYKGSELMREDENGVETVCDECPFCGKKVRRVSKSKIY